MRNNTQGFALIPLLIVAILLIVGVLFFLKTPPKSFGPVTSHQVGAFTLNIPDNYVYHKDDLNTVITTDEEGYNASDKCNRVGNMHVFYTLRKLPGLEDYYSPSISVTSWNVDNIDFLDEETKTEYKNWETQFLSLGDYTDLEKLQKRKEVKNND